MNTRRRDSAESTPARVQRYDVGEDLLAPVELSNGMLLVDMRVAKPGVLTYTDENGNVVSRELITAEELTKADSLITLGRVAMTLEHPRDGVDVTAANYQQLGVGDTDGEPDPESLDPAKGGNPLSGYIKIKGAIRRADAVEAVKSGAKVQISPGYTCRVEPAAQGSVHPTFGPYDAVQKDRRYNHVAIVGLARGGSDVRLRADGHALPPGAFMDPKKRKSLIDAFVRQGLRRDDVEAAIPEAATEVTHDAMMKMHDALGKLIEAHGAAMSQKDAQYSAMHDAFEAFKAAHPEPDGDEAKADAKALAYYAARAPLVERATALKVDAVDKLGNKALKRAIVAKAVASYKTDASDAYVDAAFDLIPATKVDPWASLPSTPVEAKTDAAPVNPAATTAATQGSQPRYDSAEGDALDQINARFKAAHGR